MRNLFISFTAASAALALTVAACSSSTPSSTPGGATSGPCTPSTQSTDCASGYACGFNADTGSCSATTGTCVRAGLAPAYSACGCDGTPVSYVAGGYTSKPVSGPYACDSGVSPTPDAGSDASTTTDAATTDASKDGAAATDASSDGSTATDSSSDAPSTDSSDDGSTDAGDQ